ncbi:MAG: GMC family oxidoreductase [Enhydrobacter sp.]|nr:MAG: GMC family oxidoreductase [Enhydrobacter sp.]
MADTFDADFVIVGSGVAGALLAWRLASSGRSTLIVEAGPRIDRSDALMRFFAAPIKHSNSPYPATPWAPSPNEAHIGDYYIQDGPVSFHGTYLRAVGGTTWHWGGTAQRLYPNDFRMKTAFGVALDWPLTYDDLAPWYDRAEAALGVAGSRTNSLGPARTTDFPLPEIPFTYLDRQVAAVSPAHGLTLGTHPQARNSIDFDGRPACCGSASCVPLCPVGAKYDGAVHVAKAETAGARVLDSAVVTRLVPGDDRRIASLRFRRPDGSEGTVTGRTFIVAAHAIETPKLLLASRDERAPDGLANSSDQLGRNLMGHYQKGFAGIAAKPLYPYRGPVETAGFREFRDHDKRGEYAAVGCGLTNEGFSRAIGPLKTAAALAGQGMRGKALDRAIAERTEREFLIGGSAEMLPDPANRVRPDFDRLDGGGQPRPRIAFKVADYTLRGLAVTQAKLRPIVDALGCTQVVELGPVTVTSNIAGTARMGTDPRTSVVDANLRAHDHPNLYMVGSAVFPTTGANPPTLTIAALSLRLASHLAA